MILCKRPNIPTPPQEIIDESLKMIESDDNLQWSVKQPMLKSFPFLTNSKGETIHGSTYKRFNVNNKILTWAMDAVDPTLNFTPSGNFRIGIQVFEYIYNGEPCSYAPHTDGPRGDDVLNYLIDAGGENVITKWYQEKGQPFPRLPSLRLDSFENLFEVHSEKFDAGAWFILNTKALHTVENLTRSRISISIGLTNGQTRY